MGKLTDIAAALLCIGAGLYLLQYNAASDGTGVAGTSWFEIIGHGMGIYFIGKGLFVGRQGYHAYEQTKSLRWLAYVAQLDHPNAGPVDLEAAVVEAGYWNSGDRKRAKKEVARMMAEGDTIEEALAKLGTNGQASPPV